MTDLQINIALAKAMGWKPLSEVGFWVNDETGVYEGFKDVIVCQDLQQLRGWKVFDYRDPVIFVAICERWKLDVSFRNSYVIASGGKLYSGYHSMQYAAALCVIELEGVKL